MPAAAVTQKKKNQDYTPQEKVAQGKGNPFKNTVFLPVTEKRPKTTSAKDRQCWRKNTTNNSNTIKKNKKQAACM